VNQISEPLTLFFDLAKGDLLLSEGLSQSKLVLLELVVFLLKLFNIFRKVVVLLLAPTQPKIQAINFNLKLLDYMTIVNLITIFFFLYSIISIYLLEMRFA
jgi:hypothetical protein